MIAERIARGGAILALLLGFPTTALAELAVGAVAGVSIPGLQDIKLKTVTPPVARWEPRSRT